MSGTEEKRADKPRRTAYLTFSSRGEALANRLRRVLGGDVSRTGETLSLDQWTRAQFDMADALIYVGAAGIAVRAIAPYVKDKTHDPAVVAVDETGRYAVPLLSGHLGGANALAKEIADICGAEAVITTATDRHGVFAVDEWARVQGVSVIRPERIKMVSAKCLDGGEITVYSAFPIDGEMPAGIRLLEKPDGNADVSLDTRRDAAGLILVPRALVLGIGARRGVTQEQVEARFKLFCEETGFYPEAVAFAATIDRKQDEAGLVAFCNAHGFALKTYSARELEETGGTFSASDFVRDTVGVDNVCERAALRASGGTLAAKKFAGDGVTFALAKIPYRASWRATDG